MVVGLRRILPKPEAATSVLGYVLASPRLSDKARQMMDDATDSDVPLAISAATLVELVYLVKKDTFMQTHLAAFHDIIDAADSGFKVVPIDNAVTRAVSKIPRAAVADPFDRIIAAGPGESCSAGDLRPQDPPARRRGNHLVNASRHSAVS